MTFPKLSGFIYFSKAFQIQLLFQVFHERMNPECDDRMRLSKSDKNIGADNIFGAADSGDVLAHH